MKALPTLHFTLLAYRNYDKQIDPEWRRLALVTEDGTVVASQDINARRWKTAKNSTKELCKNELLSTIYQKLQNYSDYRPEFTIAQDIYDAWYKWNFFIDGEDAKEFIISCGNSQHSHHFQTAMGVRLGWKYFKRLKAHDFLTSTAADLAFMRGYLGGMEANSPWSSEGMEALHCLGLNIEGGSQALMQ